VFEGTGMRLQRNLKKWFSPSVVERTKRPEQRTLLEVEELETRALLSASGVVDPLLAVVPQAAPMTGPSGLAGFTPQQIQQAYGFNAIPQVNGVNINGAGETIAIVDAYYDPTIVSDVQQFNTAFNLQQFNSTNGPMLKVVSYNGGSASTLSQDSTGGWALETSLDVEWAHAIAPQANILLVEAANENLSGTGSLLDAVQYAASQKGVVAVSMSWGENEFSTESSYDSYFIPPSTNPGVVFVAASGDNGAASGPIYPATSPYILAVGGTTLSTTTSSSGGAVYSSESTWSGSGGGAAAYEGEPSYQFDQTSINNTYGFPNVYNPTTGVYSYSRMTPDVAYNADPNSGYDVYDSTPSADYGFGGGWGEVGGTSAGSPQWASIVALADQQRIAQGGTALDTNQVQTTLYNSLSNGNYSKIFHDITTGSNGYPAGTGYDIATGLGSPIANQLVPFLAGSTISIGKLPTIQGSGYGGTGLGTATTGFFSSSGFSFTSGSFFAMSAGGRAGGGLYTGAGSLSFPPGSVQVGVPGDVSPISPIGNPLPSGVSLPITGASANTLAAFSFTASATPTPMAPTNGLALAPPVSNLAPAQNSNVFGATGWIGESPSMRLSSIGLPGVSIEELANNLTEQTNDSSNAALLDDSSSTEEDAVVKDDSPGTEGEAATWEAIFQNKTETVLAATSAGEGSSE
jgi:subtilase family serine protease